MPTADSMGVHSMQMHKQISQRTSHIQVTSYIQRSVRVPHRLMLVWLD